MKLTIEDGRKELYQWDTNRKLVIEDDINVDYLHFEDLSTDEGLAYKVIVKEKDGKRYGDIPNICLANGSTKLVVYAIYADEEGVSTITKTIFPIKRRQKPSDYELTDDNIVTVESILEMSQKAQKASEDARDLSKGYMDATEIYKDLARKYAENPENIAIDPEENNEENKEYSAKHWAKKSYEKFNEIDEKIGNATTEGSVLHTIEIAKKSAITTINNRLGDESKEGSVLKTIKDAKDSSVTTINNKLGDESTDGTVLKAIKDAKDSAVTTINTRLGDESKEGSVLKTIKDAKDSAVTTINNRLGDESKEGSVLKTIKDAKDSSITTINNRLGDKETPGTVLNDIETARLKAIDSVKSIYELDMENHKQEVDQRVTEVESQVTQKVDGAVVEDGYLILYAGKTEVAKLTGFGGSGGGGGSSSTIRVTNTSGSITKTIASGSDCILSFDWSSTIDGNPTGNGILTISVNGKEIKSNGIEQGSVSINVKDYLLENTSNTVVLKITDLYDVTRLLKFTIKVVAYSLASTFIETTVQTGDIQYYFTPSGEGVKTMHFMIDGNEMLTKQTASNNRQDIVTIPSQSHGVHSIQVWFTANVGGEEITSNVLSYNIICTEEGNTNKIIALRCHDTFLQYYTNTVRYQIWTPSHYSDVTLFDGDNEITIANVDTTEHTWSIVKNDLGSYLIYVSSGDTREEKYVEVVESGITLNPATTGLELYLSSKGHVVGSPLEWSYNGIDCIFTGFNGTSDGWQFDEENIPVLRLVEDARLVIPFSPFSKEVSVYGKTIEFEFSTSNVFDYDSVVISCLSGGRGIEATAQSVTLYSSENSLYTQYKEDEHIRVSFVISASTDKSQGNIVYCYINGIMSGAYKYSTDLFEQEPPVYITIGSNGCTTDIYNVRIYDRALTRYEIVDNWLADTQDSTLAHKYLSNDIYENDIVTEEKVLSIGLPCLVIEGSLPMDKGDKKTVSGRYTDPDDNTKSFTFEGASIDVQGTSSKDYPRKNYKMKFENGFTMENGNIVSSYPINDGIPTDTFTFKADYASSEGANNVELVKLYNDISVYRTPPQKENPSVRQGIDGFPIAIFHGTEFIGKYNFNYDKGTEEVYGFTSGDESWEITGNGSDRQLFKSADFDTYAEIKEEFESRYPEKDADVVITNLKAMMSWVASTDTTVEGLTETQIQERLDKFRNEFDNYFDRDSTFLYYLFTEMFLMVDSRAKNAFPTRFNADGKWCWLPYDMDTALGIDNGGRLMFSYNLEDTDLVDGHYVYNGQKSVIWNNLRMCFSSELAEYYRSHIRNNDRFNYESIEKQFEDHQYKWPVSMWNEDAYYKYIEPLLKTNDDKLYMLQGSKEQQRKWWLFNRFRYIDSKYASGAAKQNTIVFRAYSNNKGTYSSFELTPYSDIYTRVEFAEKHATERASRLKKSTLRIDGISNPNNLVVRIFSADQLIDVGDLSGFLPDEINFSSAYNLHSIKVGDSSDTYTNPNLKSLALGSNRLLRTIDARNCVALNTSVDASLCYSLTEAYFENTMIPSISLPDGGALETLHLPSSIVSLELRNLYRLTDLVVPSYENVARLWIVNPSDHVMSLVLGIVTQLPDNARVRAMGIAVDVSSIEEIDSFFSSIERLKGLDANGQPTVDTAQMSGTLNVDTITFDEKEYYESKYQGFIINANHLKCRVRFYDESGSTLLMDPVFVEKGAAVSYTGTVPLKPATAQYTYAFAGWSHEKNSDENNLYEGLNKVETNLDLYAAFRATLRYYTIKFVNASYSPATVLQSNSTAYGETPVYAEQTPVYNPSASDVDDWGEFIEWAPAIVPVVGDATYTAKFKSLSSKTRKLLTKTIRVAESDIVTSIGNSAFYKCSALTSVSFPSATSIEKSAFSDCRALTSVSLSTATSIGGFAFNYCTSLTSVSLPVATSIGESAFYVCSALTSISLPVATSIGKEAFYQCNALTSVSLPAVTSIEESAFNYCSSLTSVSLPVATSIGYGAFLHCSALTSISLPVATSIGQSAFESCNRLTTMYIGTESNTVCTLVYKNAIPSNVTKIYVPFPLVNTYKTATNWSLFADKIAAYEEPVECVSLSITADNVAGYETTATVHYTAVCKYNKGGASQGDSTKTFTGTGKSDAFEKNLSTVSSRQVVVSYTFLGKTATTTITQSKYIGDPVGGAIFYIDSSADGEYEFYDAEGNVISSVAVGDSPAMYKVLTPGTKDKYYVCNTTLYPKSRWTYYKNGKFVYTSLGTSLNIGTGRANTATVMAADDGAYITMDSSGYPTIWYQLQLTRDAAAGGCDDWFVPSRYEMEEVMKSGLLPFSDKSIWSSSEETSSLVWACNNGNWGNYAKTNTNAVFFVRAF